MANLVEMSLASDQLLTGRSSGRRPDDVIVLRNWQPRIDEMFLRQVRRRLG